MPQEDAELNDRLTDATRQSRIRQRRYRADQPKAADEMIAAVMSRRSYGRILSMQRINDALHEAVGDRMARFVQAAHLRRGRLDVVVGNSVMLQELTYQHADILARLGRALPDEHVSDLRFRLGQVDPR
jgi:hypothetical protein